MKYNSSAPKRKAETERHTRQIAENPYLDGKSAARQSRGSRPLPQNPYAPQKPRGKRRPEVSLPEFIQETPTNRRLKKAAGRKGSAQKQRAPERSAPPRRPPSGAEQAARARSLHDNALRHRKRHKKNYILYYIFLLLILGVTGTVLSLTVFFNVEQIKIVGDTEIAANDIIAASEVKIGENMFRMNIGSVASKIETRFVTIENVKISRKFPATMEISVLMAVPKAAIEYEGSFFTISEGNRVIGLDKAPLSADLIRISGIAMKNIALGDNVSAENDGVMATLDKALSSVKESEMLDITGVDLTDDMAIKFFIGEQYEIRAGGTANLTYKLHCADEIIKKELEDKTIKGVIDVSVDNGVYYFRPAEKIEMPSSAA